MYPDYLIHHGVKGMKWGIRKKNYQLEYRQNKRYGKNQRKTDRDIYGARGEIRINKRMNKGQTHKQASRREFGRQVVRGTAATAGLAAAAFFAANPSAGKALINSGKNVVSKALSNAKGFRMDSIGKYYDPGKDIVGKLLRR